jgi:adenylate cyclase
VRMAINTGIVVVGEMGSANRVDYTVLGNTVNVSARLEELVARPGQIVLGPATYEAVSNLFPTEYLGEFHLRGLHGKLPVYRLATEALDERSP